MKRRRAEVGIVDEDVARRMPFQLSGGMCQRVALAAALARDLEPLIADEPSTARHHMWAALHRDNRGQLASPEQCGEARHRDLSRVQP